MVLLLIVVLCSTTGKTAKVDVFQLLLLIVWKVMIILSALSACRIIIYLMVYAVNTIKIILLVLVLVLLLQGTLMIVPHNIINRMMYVVRRVSIMINMR